MREARLGKRVCVEAHVEEVIEVEADAVDLDIDDARYARYDCNDGDEQQGYVNIDIAEHLDALVEAAPHAGCEYGKPEYVDDDGQLEAVWNAEYVRCDLAYHWRCKSH